MDLVVSNLEMPFCFQQLDDDDVHTPHAYEERKQQQKEQSEGDIGEQAYSIIIRGTNCYTITR